MRGPVVIAGLFLLVGGAVVAGARYAPEAVIPLGDARDALSSQPALITGGAAAGIGLLVLLFGVLPGPKDKPSKMTRSIAQKASPARLADPPARAETAPQPGGPAIAMTAPFQNASGHGWLVMPEVDPEVRKLSVLENGRALGPADALHSDIFQMGGGRHSHWKTTDGVAVVYFSSSDNSDPNTNGRTYELR